MSERDSPSQGTVPCSACGGVLDSAEAIPFKGHAFHESCYLAERFADPDALIDGPGEPLVDVPSAVMEAIAARGVVVVARL